MPKQAKKDEQLAEEPTFQKYAEKPIQTFGLSLLKNMGFSQSRGIGHNKQNALLKPLQLKPRPKGLGLGAKPQDYVQEKQEFVTGDYIQFLNQPHQGMLGVVKSVNQDIITIQFQVSGAEIKINREKIQKLTKQQFMRKKTQLLQINQHKTEKKLKRLKWVIPNIRVKITSQSSKYYLKKVIVTQLISEREFECLQIDQQGNKNYIRNLRQKDIQSIIPKIGQIILMLDKDHKGQKAKLLQRNKSKGQVVVQNLQELNIVKIEEDLVSQYVNF